MSNSSFKPLTLPVPLMGDCQQFSEGGLLFPLPPCIASALNDSYDTTVRW